MFKSDNDRALAKVNNWMKYKNSSEFDAIPLTIALILVGMLIYGL